MNIATPEADVFVRWSLTHWGAITAVLLLTAGLLWYGRRADETTRHRLCRVSAVIIALLFIGETAWRLYGGAEGPLRENLPLHYCSFMTVLAVVALWTRRQWACAAVYFGVLTASIQGLITPVLEKDFPAPAFLFFFLSHGLLFTAALAVPCIFSVAG